MTTQDYGYLQHSAGSGGPFRTERVPVRCVGTGSEWHARFEGRWRTVHMQVNRLYIVYQGKRITIQIDGV